MGTPGLKVEVDEILWAGAMPSAVRFTNGDLQVLFNLFQIAKQTQIAYSTLYSWVTHSTIPLWSVKAGNRRFTTRELVRQYVQFRGI